MPTPSSLKIAAALLLLFPVALTAQTTAPAAPSTPRAAASPSQRIPPFRGNITSSDAAAQTFTIQGKVKTRVFKVTSQTKLVKRAGGAATFADLKAGEYVTGIAKKLGAGQYEAETVKVGPKTTGTAAASPSASPGSSPRSRRSRATATPTP